MPARAVPKNYRNVTGRVYNSRTRSSSAFDSTLECDYLLLLDFDLAVDFYEEQPVTIEYCDSRGSLRRYTPDVLVRYRSAVNAISVPLSVLCEVKYRDDLRRPTMEEIGYRTDIFTLDGIPGSQREYIHWLLSTCTQGKVEPDAIVTADAIDLLASKLRTPLQIQLYLTLALEAGYQAGETLVTAALVETLLSKQLDDLEPTLTRHGYRLRDLVEQFDVKPTEIKALFSNRLDPARTAEFRDRMLTAGLPL
jgi:hypothetical protein